MGYAKLCFSFTTKSLYITPPNTHACNLQGRTACFGTLLEMLIITDYFKFACLF